MNTGALIEGRRITKRYGHTNVLSGVDVCISAGQVVGIVGENGSGKSTLLQILAGIMPPTSGFVERRGSVGYCPQDTLVFEALTVTENLRYFAAAAGLCGSLLEERAEGLLATLALTRQRHDIVSRLSGGSKQKLNLVVALLNNPAVLLLDEPCSGLDWDTYLSFWALANRARDVGKSIVIVSHLIHERANFDALLTLRNGAILQ
jgi:ABC-type multidrug transport system ATPase subunit